MKIYKVTNAQLKALLEKGSITVGGTTYTYNSEDVYVVTDGFPEYRLSEGVAKNIVQLTKDGVVVATATVDEVNFATTSNKAQMLVSKGPTESSPIYETANSIREKTVAPLVTADTVLTADLAQNIVAVGYFETGTKDVNERWFVMQDATLNPNDKWLEAFRWDAYDTTIVYTVSWNLNGKWSSAEVNNYTLASINDVDKKLNKVTTTTPYNQVYAKTTTGAQAMQNMASSVLSDSLVYRDGEGKSQIATPTDSDNVKTIANVEYVKNYVKNNSSKLTVTDNEDGTVTLNIV